MVPIICVLNHERISWVSIEIYYHDNFVFGHIFMFLTSSPAGWIHKGPGKGPGQTRGGHNRADDHENVNEKSSRLLPSKASIQGYLHRGDRRAPPPGKLHTGDAGGVTAHMTYAKGTRDTLPAES